ncbi:predicted protein [Lichtheimia corymbifera JMRC:FSU:9682]|uniref:Uncharacterized protein n=1 Tax=Lichtheimia corymbifera JMRC:FSU:9682 TaxID=1263082 RepID=A0A068S920_9FUNG|nr:predicted protein [Lichtheimia corymbifera JMRC:FSU:9682]
MLSSIVSLPHVSFFPPYHLLVVDTFKAQVDCSLLSCRSQSHCYHCDIRFLLCLSCFQRYMYKWQQAQAKENNEVNQKKDLAWVCQDWTTKSFTWWTLRSRL